MQGHRLLPARAAPARAGAGCFLRQHYAKDARPAAATIDPTPAAWCDIMSAMDTGKVVAVCISAEEGMPRPQVSEGTLQTGRGFEGNRLSRAGDREVCLFSMETYEDLQRDGMAVGPGSFGENLTLAGVAFADLRPGDRLRVGPDAVLEISVPRKGCRNLTPFDPRLPEAIEGRSGWMARVVVGGVVQPGDSVEVTS